MTTALAEPKPISAPPRLQPEIATPVRIYTDGSILKNPGGAGGWAMVVTQGSAVIEMKSGGVPVSTNNRMELTGVLEALKWCWDSDEPDVEIITDSEYVQKGLTQWMDGWKKRNWLKVKNPTLWKRLDLLYDPAKVKISWIKGHKGHRFNEMADELAGVAARRVRDA